MNVEHLYRELKDLPEGWIVLLEIQPDKAIESNIAIIQQFVKQNYFAIIIETSRPSQDITAFLTREGLDKNTFFIIDCITKKSVKNTSNINYIEDCNKLTEISLVMTNAMKLSHQKKIVFIDSLSTLLLHNSSSTILKFIHSIITRLRLAHINCMLFSIKEQTSTEFKEKIAQLCDKTILCK